MEDKFVKLPNESELSYHKRIILGKLVDKNLSEYDYSELSKYVYGQEYSSDVARRMFYGSKRTLDLIEKNMTENITDNEVLDEIELKRISLEKERKKLQATKSEYNKYLRVDSRFELLYENIRDSIQVIEVPELYPIEKAYNDKHSVLNFSDVHYGSKFKGINNEYSREICKQRFEKLLGETIDYVKENNITDLTIINNGDSLQGMLRLSDLKANEIPVVEALVEFSQLMASFLNQLSSHVNIKYYQIPSANHMELRLLNSKAGEMATEDMEKIIINYIGDMLLNNPRIYIHREMKFDFVELDILGFNIVALHGHQVKNIKNFIRDISQRQRKFYDYAILGHFHGGMNLTVGESDINNIEVLVSPSFVGSCTYADSLMVGGKAMAKIYEFEESKGLVVTRNIILN